MRFLAAVPRRLPDVDQARPAGQLLTSGDRRVAGHEDPRFFARDVITEGYAHVVGTMLRGSRAGRQAPPVNDRPRRTADPHPGVGVTTRARQHQPMEDTVEVVEWRTV